MLCKRSVVGGRELVVGSRGKGEWRGEMNTVG